MSPTPALSGLMRLEDARTRMLEGVEPLPIETVPIADALGRVSAHDLSARLTLPPWDDSAMDGYAVRSSDVAGARIDEPVTLRVIGEVAAGHAPTASVQPGTAMRIMTGGMLPPGADAVVPVEDTDAPPGVADLPARVAIRSALSAGQHVRRAGSSMAAGDPLLQRGVAFQPGALAALAAAGHDRVDVHRRPRVAILGTGDELVPVGEPLGPAQIPDSNGVGLAAQALAAGAEVIRLGVARDELEVIVERLEAGIAAADIVVTSGGVSVGAHDAVRIAFDRVGRVDLWRVAIQPGKPLAFGRAERPGGPIVLLFGLPGNPVSSFVTFELFVRPVLRRLAGLDDLIGRPVVRARLTAAAGSSPGRRTFVRVQVGPDPADPTTLIAELAGGQGSHVLPALARSNGLAIIPEEVDTVPAGTIVDVLRIDQETT